jgi:hypothetical protein
VVGRQRKVDVGNNQRLSELPPEEQDALVAMILEELAFGQGADHPPLSIEALEEEARLEHLAGRTEPLNF